MADKAAIDRDFFAMVKEAFASGSQKLLSGGKEPSSQADSSDPTSAQKEPLAVQSSAAAALVAPLRASATLARNAVANPPSTAEAKGTSVASQNTFDTVRPRKELKSASELAAMIEHDLAQFPGCPKGLRVTVYGVAPWRAMLTIPPAAGGVREPQRWRDLTEELADRLRARYDLTWE